MDRFAIAALFVIFITLGVAAAEAAPRENVAGDTTPTIFDVRKSLPMEPTEPSFHDFYINAGAEAGFKKGQYLPVQRAIPVHDPVQNKQQALLTVPVGKILVIHVEHGMSVARLVTELTDEERPTLEYESIMIGDRIDMKGITMEAPKDIGKKRKRTAAAPVEPSPSVLATIIEKITPSAEAAPANQVPTAAAQVPAAPQQVQPVKSDAASQPSSPRRVTQPVPPPTA
ncbi:hypothetical protein BH10BDE1_BH10BDE1_32270 [soil metagenome]